MGHQPWALVTLAAACTLTLAACSKQADSNPNAQGSPGTGNGVAVARPAAPDGPAGGSSGDKGSTPAIGSSGTGVVAGTTGDASASTGAGTLQPGVGLNGGLSNGNVMGAAPSGQGATASTASPAGDGSTNMTPGSAVGRRH
jgi:hypothetical protein